MINLIREYQPAAFIGNVNELVENGFKIISSGCNYFDGEPDEGQFWAILEKQEPDLRTFKDQQ